MMNKYLTLAEAKAVAKNLPPIEDAVGSEAETWGGRCHEISLAVLRTGLFGPGRVTRGVAMGVGSQHSWITLGKDVYDIDAVIVDPTIWSVQKVEMPKILVARRSPTHTPHGSGSIWAYGRPENAKPGTEIELSPDLVEKLSPAAKHFLKLLGPLDKTGWMRLATGPMQGWPAGEILAAIWAEPALGQTIAPVDHTGHVTDINPGGLYW